MNLAPIKSRIVSTVTDLVTETVKGAAELQVAIDDTERATKPFAFVIWTGDVQVDQNPIPGQQARFSETFSVVLGVQNTLDYTGDDAIVTLEPLADELKTGLVGWAPDASHLPVTYLGSSHAFMDSHLLLHELLFETTVPGGSIFTYNIEVGVHLLPGAAVATTFAAFVTMIEAATGATRLTSDYLTDREVVAESATVYQLRQVESFVEKTADSNNPLRKISVELSVHHHLAPTDVERTYAETTMPAALATLLDSASWKVTGVDQVIDGEEPTLGLGADLARE